MHISAHHLARGAVRSVVCWECCGGRLSLRARLPDRLAPAHLKTFSVNNPWQATSKSSRRHRQADGRT